MVNVAFAVAIDLSIGFGTRLVVVVLVTTLIVLDGLDEWRFRVTHGAPCGGPRGTTKLCSPRCTRRRA